MPENTENVALTEAAYYMLSVYMPMHGYAIMQNITALSGGRVNLGAGTLYGAINNLLAKSWIIGVGDHSGRKKEYIISDLGKQMVQNELIRLNELLQNGRMVTGGKING